MFKGSLSRSGTSSDDGISFRYFSQSELRDLFTGAAFRLESLCKQARCKQTVAVVRMPLCFCTGSASTQPSPDPSSCATAVTPAGLATSETAATLEALHGGRRRCSTETAEHLRFLETLPGFVGELPYV